MASKKNYVIQAGPVRPEKMMTGYLSKKGGTPSGDIGEVGVPVGVFLLLNYSEVWGKRIVEGNKTSEVISVTDKEYKGDIEFLPWGDKNGYRLQIRYLSSSPTSLDLQYQKQILKLESGDEDAMIGLLQGENRFSYETEGLLITFLKNHFRNEDCKSKNPDIIGHDFTELTEEKQDKTASKRMESKFTAGQYVTSFSAKPESLRAMAHALLGNPELSSLDDYSSDLEVYTALLRFADANPDGMQTAIENYRKTAAADLRKATSFNKLDLSKDKVIAIIDGEGKKHILVKDAVGKGEAMLTWFVDHIFDAEVSTAYKTIAAETSKL